MGSMRGLQALAAAAQTAALYKLSSDRQAKLDAARAGSKPAVPGIPEVPKAPSAPGVGPAAATGDTASTWDRLKAGNIDQVGSDAYNQWGAGKAEGDASEASRESTRMSEQSEFNHAYQNDLPSPSAPIAPIENAYQQPAWMPIAGE